jgi:hypothetical protein
MPDLQQTTASPATEQFRLSACRQFATRFLASIAIPAGLGLSAVVLSLPAQSQGPAYNPYADSQEMLAPVAPDGTIRWGTFYKSAGLQKSYERLWNLGACRGTNKAITVPVETNKLAVDDIAEEDFRGSVVGVEGTLHGGMLAFRLDGQGDGAEARVAVLHPAGVSSLRVRGSIPVADLPAGATVRLHTRVDRQGRALEPLRSLDVIVVAADFRPEPVSADVSETLVGRVVRIHKGLMTIRVDAGRIRRLSIPLAEGALATIDAPVLELARAGDTIEVRGRPWTGEGCLAAGTVFASKVTVTKPQPVSAQVAPGKAVVASGR